MRFESLTIENYGRTKQAALTFPASPGLTVIFGRNEAGKSTALEAVADFLFGVPQRSERGQIFGADRIRLGASLVLADGTRLSLTRRKSRARALTDAAGQPVDEAALGQVLGATSRERFCSLFGLGHETLRQGGDEVLKADGDIGRLILAAGGGLTALVELVDGLRAQASELFDMRKKSDRLFYVGLKAFDEADKAVRQGEMTRERYDKARQMLNAARDTAAKRRQRLAELNEEKLRLARLARVAPLIREFDWLNERLSAFADVAPLGEDFAVACASAFAAQKRCADSLSEAEARCKALRAKIDALTPPLCLINAESAIRDVGEKALHVAKARQDRANREDELAAFGAKLMVLRIAVGVASDDELEAAAPRAEEIKTAQALVAQGLMQHERLASVKIGIERETAARDAILGRQAKRRAAGAHEPFGVDAALFATLPELAAANAAKQRQLRKIEGEIAATVIQQRFESIDELQAAAYPDTAVIQSEIDQRSAIEADLRRLAERIEAEAEKRDKAAADIERLTSVGDVATADALAAARKDRDEIFDEIKMRYLSADGAAVAARPFRDRLADVDIQQQRMRIADDLADRKSIDAERVAALELARREKVSAVAALAALAQRKNEVARALAARSEAWRAAWPEAAARAPKLGRLKLAATERAALLMRQVEWRTQNEAAAAQAAAIASRLEALEQAEAKLKLAAAATLTERAIAASRAVKAHDDAYADCRQDETALRDVELKLNQIADAHAALVAAEGQWRLLWGAAAHSLRLSEKISLERANEIATLWAAGVEQFENVRSTRRRLNRMDEDEADLRARVQAIAANMDFALPEDGVAAAKMLVERLDGARKIMIERDSLRLQLAALNAERDAIARAAEISRTEIEALRLRSGAAAAELAGLAARCVERSEIAKKCEALAKAIIQAGDDLSIEVLRESWGGRDLDAIRAATERSESEARALQASLEEALAAQQDRTREFEALTACEGVNSAVAERERAIAEMHGALERYVEIALAEELLRAAMERLRDQRKDPLIRRAGELFAASTGGAFAGVDTDVDGAGTPIVVGRRSSGEEVPVTQMSDGVRDQLYLAFRIASIEHYARAAEPLPFIADDLLVHFDDERGAAALGLLAELGQTTQVLLFTHHGSVTAAAAPLVAQNRAALIELAP